MTNRMFSYLRHGASERPVTWTALVGFMGAGKSRIGWELSRRLSLNFVDTDKVIERVSCMSIPDIFDLYGEQTFRNYETEVIRRCTRLEHAVISTGGGTVMRPQNREILQKRGPIVLLTASPETTYKRTKRRGNRPLLQVDDPLERIRQLKQERDPYYRLSATIEVSTDGRRSADVVEEIVSKLHEWHKAHPTSSNSSRAQEVV